MAPFKLKKKKKKIKTVFFVLAHCTEAENCLLDVLKVILTKEKKKSKNNKLLKVDLQYQHL